MLDSALGPAAGFVIGSVAEKLQGKIVTRIAIKKRRRGQAIGRSIIDFFYLLFLFGTNGRA